MLEHLKSRGMDPSLYKLAISEDTVTFFLYNPTGKLVGYQQYRPSETNKKCNDPKLSRYFTYLPKETDGLFGLEQDSGEGPLFIVEGVFKATTLHRLGFNAVAVLGATPKRLKSQFCIWKATRRLIAIGDPDSAGAALVRLVGCGVQSPLDLDEMPDDEVLKLIEGIM